ncbi:hypothetical protein Q8W71_30755 [Methylobacterium sp. NEAU 140]|uniref:hypothetical protein n=1 Tax=Methylobacterium sp. NEAU 140 TaxID=3064945 RepID=UPI002732C34F|nr:hypothetical protein [Methylobacterium sp. NEAU 140]MDP4026973.1 hypothetical protein [Methylobacterium sp. NEAU 140]
MPLLGHVGTLTHRRIAGWAWDRDAPDERVWLVVSIERRVVGRIRADQFREDVAIEGKGDGWCGFALDLPAGVLNVRRAYAISVRRDGDSTHLPGSPYVLEPAVRLVR